MDFDPQKNYYDILGVAEDASQDEIKKAFKKLAIQHHPDKWGDKARFQEVNEAHQVLGDQSKRQQYDAYRKGWFSGFGGADFGWFSGGDFGGFDIGDIVGDIFGWFGWWSRKKWPRKGDDIQVSISIDFDEAYLWVKKKVRYSRLLMAEWVEQKTCPSCNGRGVTTQQARTPFGVMQVQNTCQECGWLGSIYEKSGKRVGQWWLQETTEVIDVEVPAGIKEWVYLKYTGKGNMWLWGGWAGDLYIKINIKSSSDYRRDGDDLYIIKDMTLFDLVLGWKLKIKHPEWVFDVTIPKGTQPDDMIKVANKGFGRKWILQSRGDLFIQPKIIIPKKLSKDQEKLRKELQKKSE